MFAVWGDCWKTLPTHIRRLANKVILNVGRAVGGFSSVIIGVYLDNYNLLAVMVIFISTVPVLLSFIMMSIKGFEERKQSNPELIQVK